MQVEKVPGMQLHGHCNRAVNHGDQTLIAGTDVGTVAQQVDKSNYCNLNEVCAYTLFEDDHLPVLISICIVFKIVWILWKSVSIQRYASFSWHKPFEILQVYREIQYCGNRSLRVDAMKKVEEVVKNERIGLLSAQILKEWREGGDLE